jgi:hypothetical protein
MFDQDLQHYELHELMERAEDQELLQFENPDIETQDDGTLVGDNIAPYFALNPGEYIKQADRDEQAQPPFNWDLTNWDLTPEESDKQNAIDRATSSLRTQLLLRLMLLVHTPIALPPDLDVDFTFWVQNFTLEATVAGVWDMIAPPDGATAATIVAFIRSPLTHGEQVR